MNLLKNLAALAIRKQVTGALRAHCPEPLRDALETLLADDQAVTAIRNHIASKLKDPAAITADSLLRLELPDTARRLLSDNDELLRYLVDTARSRLGA